MILIYFSPVNGTFETVLPLQEQYVTQTESLQRLLRPPWFTEMTPLIDILLSYSNVLCVFLSIYISPFIFRGYQLATKVKFVMKKISGQD